LASKTVLLVFVDPTESPALAHLRRGFRHCFCALRDGSRWIICDSLKYRTELAVLELPPAFNLAAFYRSQGHHVLSVNVRHQSRRHNLSVEPLTCVAVAKRVLGLWAPRIFTPWQLYRRLLFGRNGARTTL
jgi:hypothetical protein